MPYYEHFIGENNQNRKKKNFKKNSDFLAGVTGSDRLLSINERKIC